MTSECSEFDTDQRVKFVCSEIDEIMTGTVLGRGSKLVLYTTYIVRLDEPVSIDGQVARAIVVPGYQIEAADV